MRGGQTVVLAATFFVLDVFWFFLFKLFFYLLFPLFL